MRRYRPCSLSIAVEPLGAGASGGVSDPTNKRLI